MKPPLNRIELGHARLGPDATRGAARPRVPGDIGGVAAQPFPHQPRPVDSAEPQVISNVAPETACRNAPPCHQARAGIGPGPARRRSRPAPVLEYIEIITAARLANRNATGAQSPLLGWFGKLASA